MEFIHKEVIYIAANSIVISIIYIVYLTKNQHKYIRYEDQIFFTCLVAFVLSLMVLFLVPNRQEIAFIVNKETYKFYLKNENKDTTDCIASEKRIYELGNSAKDVKNTMLAFKSDSISGFYVIYQHSILPEISKTFVICTKNKYDSLKHLGYYEFKK